MSIATTKTAVLDRVEVAESPLAIFKLDGLHRYDVLPSETVATRKMIRLDKGRRLIGLFDKNADLVELSILLDDVQ